MPICTHLSKFVDTFAHPKFVRDHMACEDCAMKKTHANFQYRDVQTESMIVADQLTIKRLRQIIADMQERFESHGNAGTAHWDTTPAAKEDFEIVMFERQGKRMKRKRYKNFNFGVRSSEIVTRGGPMLFTWRLYHCGGAF